MDIYRVSETDGSSGRPTSWLERWLGPGFLGLVILAILSAVLQWPPFWFGSSGQDTVKPSASATVDAGGGLRSVPFPTAGRTNTVVGTLTVLGASRIGKSVTVTTTGTHRFTYRSGSYSTNSADLEKTWLTAIFIFQGDTTWEGERLRGEDAILRLADRGYWASASEAEAAVAGTYLEVDLKAGDVLTFVGVDHRSYYSDNPGQVILEWSVVAG